MSKNQYTLAVHREGNHVRTTIDVKICQDDVKHVMGNHGKIPTTYQVINMGYKVTVPGDTNLFAVSSRHISYKHPRVAAIVCPQEKPRIQSGQHCHCLASWVTTLKFVLNGASQIHEGFRERPSLNLIQDKSHVPHHIFPPMHGGVPNTPELLGQIQQWKMLMMPSLSRPAKMSRHLGGFSWCGRPEPPTNELKQYCHLIQILVFYNFLGYLVFDNTILQISSDLVTTSKNKKETNIPKKQKSGHLLDLTLLLTPLEPSIDVNSILFGHSALEPVHCPWRLGVEKETPYKFRTKEKLLQTDRDRYLATHTLQIQGACNLWPDGCSLINHGHNGPSTFQSLSYGRESLKTYQTHSNSATREKHK